MVNSPSPVPADAWPLPCDTCPQAGPLARQLAAIENRLDRLDEAMFGDGRSKRGIVEHVAMLVEITRVGRSTFRVFIWCGAALIALATAAYQVKQTISTFFHP